MRTHLTQGSSPASANLWSQPVNCGLQAGFDCRARPCVKTQKSSQMQTKQTNRRGKIKEYKQKNWANFVFLVSVLTILNFQGTDTFMLCESILELN